MAEHTVYAVASGKGGVGKTTTTVNLGTALAQQGHAVALVDADLGMANLGGYLGVGEEGRTLHEVLAGEADLEAAVYEVQENLAVVPSGISLKGFANVETAALSEAVDALEDAFDYVLLDIGAGLSHDSVLPLALADAVLLVSTPDPLALTDTAKTREVTERLGGAVAGTVITRAKPTGDFDVEDVEDQIGIPVLAVVPDDDVVHESAEAGRPVVGVDPDNPVAAAYRGLADVVVEESLANAPVIPEVPEPEPEPEPEPGPDPEPSGDAVDAAPPEPDATDRTPERQAPPADEPPGTSEPRGADAQPQADTDPASSPDGPAEDPDLSPQQGQPERPSDPAGRSDEPAPGGPADDRPPAGEGQPRRAGDDRDLVPETETERTAEEIAAAIEDAAEEDDDESALTFDGQADSRQPDDDGLRFDETGPSRGGGGADPEEAPPYDGADAADGVEEPVFAVEGAEPDADDDDDDEGGLLSRLFGG